MTRLNLGSGFEPMRDWVNIDLSPSAPAEIHGPVFPLGRSVTVIREGGTAHWIEPFPDGSVSEIRAVDVAEHVSYRETAVMFAEWARVLQPGGKLYVRVPDAQQCIDWYVRTPGRLVERLPPELAQTPLMGLTWRLLGGHADGVGVRAGEDFRLNAHYALFSDESLRMALGVAGFAVESVTCDLHPNLCCTARKR